jgi:transposase
MKLLKQNSGIDIAKDTFVAGFSTIDMGQNVLQKRPKTFKNNLSGYVEYLNWIAKFQVADIPMTFTMEATGVYYEGLAYFLHEKDKRVSVLLPNTVNSFARSLNAKSKTDKIDAKILGQMGVERVLPEWKVSSTIYRELKTLTRERQSLIENRTAEKNRLHAEEHTAYPMKTVITRMKNHIKYLNKQIESIEKELKKKVSKDDFVSEKIKKVSTIPGVKFTTAVTIAAETQGFDNFSSSRQLFSFAGYDIQLKESGKFKGKTTISKKGNSHIRRAMYMPSLSAKTHTQTYQRIYDRLYEKKEKGMIAGTAIQRKLLGLIYTLWKNDTTFIDNYESKKAS